MPDLDARQQAAVQAGPGDLFIAAGAGSGKTRVLTARFVAAVLGEPPYAPTDPAGLPTITFTDKAAAELTERIREALAAAGRPDAARRINDAWVSTIHGMCSRILRRHALAIGIDPHFGVLDHVEAQSLEADALEEALAGLIETDPDVADLVDAYGLDEVVRSALGLRSTVAAMGCDSGVVRGLAPGQPEGRLRELAERAMRIAADFGDLRGTKTTADNAASARGLVAAVREEVARGADAHGDGRDPFDGLTFRHMRSIEGHEELVDEAREILDEARACVAERQVERFRNALMRVVEDLTIRYGAMKRARGALDFEDLQVRAAALLESDPAVAAAYRTGFSMVMIDEFQDTNALQMRIARALTRGNLCTVGDESQSIYAFRHADVEVFRERGRQAACRVELDTNYRTARTLLATTNGLFSHAALLGSEYMKLRSPDEQEGRAPIAVGRSRFRACLLDTSAAKGSDPRELEAGCIADRVAEHVEAGVAPGEIAVLMGALASGRGALVERALASRGIPALLASGGRFFGCPEIVETRALLRLIDNVRDDRALATVLAGDMAGLGVDALYEIRASADRIATEDGVSARAASMWEGLDAAREALSVGHAAVLERVEAVVQDARRRRGVRPLGDTVLEPLLALDMDLTLFARGREGARAWSNVLKLARMADEFERTHSGDLGAFLRHLDLREAYSTGETEATLDGEADAVRIMTIHAAKGLEFPVVVVGGLSSGMPPGDIVAHASDSGVLLGMALPGEDGRRRTLSWLEATTGRAMVRDAEAKRLFYVACTRARDALTVVGRTRIESDADDSLIGLLRRALGMSGAGSVAPGLRAVGEGSIEVLVEQSVPAVEPQDEVPGTTGCDAPAVSGHNVGTGRRGASCDDMPRQEPPLSAPPMTVSYTALAAYARCPYRYYLSRVARLMPPPADAGTDALAFGDAVHLVLQRCDGPSADPSLYSESAAKAAGLPPGRTVDVARAARAFLVTPVAQRVVAAERVAREVPILTRVGDSVLVGALDLIAWSGTNALIVDYKTGSVDLPVDEARSRYTLQAECYALAAFAAGAASVEVVFTELERDRAISFEYADTDTPALEGRVSSIVDAIAAGRFDPLDQYVRGLCDTCAGFGGLCPVTRAPDGAAG